MGISMLTLPIRVRRKKQPYVAIRSRLTKRQVRKQATLFLPEVRDYLDKQGIEDYGPAFMRFNTLGGTEEGDMEFGYFTDKQYVVPYPMRSGMLPGGTYSSITWHGDYEKFTDVTTLLLGWGEMNDIEWETARFDAAGFDGCRLAIFHRTPRTAPNPDDWTTELVMLHKAVD